MCRDQDVAPCCSTGAEVDPTRAHAKKRLWKSTNEEDSIAIGAIGRLLQGIEGKARELTTAGAGGGDASQSPSCAQLPSQLDCDPESWEDFDDFALPPPALALNFDDEPEEDSEDEWGTR